MPPTLAGIDTARAQCFLEAESAAYAAARPRSQAMAPDLARGFYQGVPMHWMRDWPMPFPMIIAQAQGAEITDIDGHVLADFCLGDTGSMFGHSPEPVARAIAAQASIGLTYMLPTPKAAEIGALLAARFGLPHWQIAATATDANRYALRVARAVTGRSKILVFNGCYHGTVDETFVRLVDGRAVPRPGLIGQANDPTGNAVVVEFNDVPELKRALAAGDIACVITEPVLTNSAMVLPEPGFHAALRRLTREAGALLLIDETHTISTGPGGYTRRYGLDPDLFVLGKPIAGGVPAAVWGFTDDVAARLDAVRAQLPPGHSGMGTTLSANALTLAAMHGALTEVMTDEAYAHMELLAAKLEAGLVQVIEGAQLPWHVARMGARVEFIFAAHPLKNGTEAEATHIHLVESAVHLGLLNRGALIAPFHNMMLVSPATSEADVARLVAAFEETVDALCR
jgi:glutamate-1-semialdehyde 2,1-aminomutase